MSLIPRTDRSIVFGPVNNRLLYLGTNFSALLPSCGSDRGVNILGQLVQTFICLALLVWKMRHVMGT